MRLVLSLCILQSATALTVWPKPQSESRTAGVGLLSIDIAAFDFVATGASSSILSSAFKRYRGIMGLESASASRQPLNAAAAKTITACDVNVLSDSMELSLETDEHYNLTIAAPTVTISAASVYAALRGLETLSQLVDHGLTVNATSIVDYPRYAYRGFMIDTSRHYYPLTTILMHLDAMAYSKFNVLHWHLVDVRRPSFLRAMAPLHARTHTHTLSLSLAHSHHTPRTQSVSFPFESTTYPEMSKTGSYSPSHVYTPSDVAQVITYATERGIRVIPEFDTPGHVATGYASLDPPVLTQCYDKAGKANGFGPLNPTLNATYDFLTKFFSEIKNVFPDKFVHVGGDEVSPDCWQSNQQIQDWIKQHPTVKTFGDLEQYYELELLTILKNQGTSYICWQEIFDNGVKILPDTVVEVWKGGNWQDDMARVSAAGYHSVLSAPLCVECSSPPAGRPSHSLSLLSLLSLLPWRRDHENANTHFLRPPLPPPP